MSPSLCTCVLMSLSLCTCVLMSPLLMCAMYSFRQLQVTSESQLSEVHNEHKLKAFEADRTRLVHEETCRVLQQAQLDNEKLSSKLDVCWSRVSC